MAVSRLCDEAYQIKEAKRKVEEWPWRPHLVNVQNEWQPDERRSLMVRIPPFDGGKVEVDIS